MIETMKVLQRTFAITQIDNKYTRTTMSGHISDDDNNNENFSEYNHIIGRVNITYPGY